MEKIHRQVSTVYTWEEKWWQQMGLKPRMAFSYFTPFCSDELFSLLAFIYKIRNRIKNTVKDFLK